MPRKFSRQLKRRNSRSQGFYSGREMLTATW
jgi:hypothetical protein